MRASDVEKRLRANAAAIKEAEKLPRERARLYELGVDAGCSHSQMAEWAGVNKINVTQTLRRAREASE